MPDQYDRAQAINEQHQADALDAWRRRQPTGLGLTHCRNCDEEIPERRRLAVPGCDLCIDCQTALEKGGKR